MQGFFENKHEMCWEVPKITEVQRKWEILYYAEPFFVFACRQGHLTVTGWKGLGKPGVARAASVSVARSKAYRQGESILPKIPFLKYA